MRPPQDSCDRVTSPAGSGGKAGVTVSLGPFPEGTESPRKHRKWPEDTPCPTLSTAEKASDTPGPPQELAESSVPQTFPNCSLALMARVAQERHGTRGCMCACVHPEVKEP